MDPDLSISPKEIASYHPYYMIRIPYRFTVVKRSIPLTRGMIDELRRWRSVHLSDQAAAGASCQDDSFVVTNELGKFFEQRTFRDCCDRSLKVGGALPMNHTVRARPRPFQPKRWILWRKAARNRFGVIGGSKFQICKMVSESTRKVR